MLLRIFIVNILVCMQLTILEGVTIFLPYKEMMIKNGRLSDSIHQPSQEERTAEITPDLLILTPGLPSISLSFFVRPLLLPLSLSNIKFTGSQVKQEIPRGIRNFFDLLTFEHLDVENCVVIGGNISPYMCISCRFFFFFLPLLLNCYLLR